MLNSIRGAMSTASDRLALYLATEKSILSELGQEMRHDQRILRQADLKEVRDQIDKLVPQVASERQAAVGNYAPFTMLADLSGRHGRG